MDYDAVFWDVGGVMLDIDSMSRAQRAFVARLVETYDLELTPDAAISTWRETMRDHFLGREGRTYRTAREARRKAASALFDGDPPADWEATYRETTDEVVELTPGIEATLRTLADAGVYQAVISDADVGLTDRLESYGLRQYLTHVTTSEEAGYVKPDRRVFETAFEKARARDLTPERGVMVGDKYKNDMEGGSAMGLTTVGFGAEDGPAVDHQVDDLTAIPDILGIAGQAEEGDRQS